MSGGLLVPAAVVLAAALHAGWNATAHRIADPAVGVALIGIAAASVCALVVPFAAVPAPAARPLLLGSVAVHLLYNLLLARAYTLGDFGQVYPLARGTSPLVVAVLSVTVVGQPLSATEAAGVLVVSVGLGVLVSAAGGWRTTARPAVLAAVATGLCIAGYTVLDGVGVRRAAGTAGYIGWLFLLQGPLIAAALLIPRGRAGLAQARRSALPGLLSGVVSLVAYGIVIWAQTRARLAQVASLRELSILFGAVLGALFFHEAFGRRRTAGAALAVLGVLLLER